MFFELFILPEPAGRAVQGEDPTPAGETPMGETQKNRHGGIAMGGFMMLYNGIYLPGFHGI